MTSQHRTTLSGVLTAAVLLGPLFVTPALASPAAEAKATYVEEMSVCRQGRTTQALGTCIAEAKAAYRQNLQGLLADRSPHYKLNALKRCDVHRGTDRLACRAMVEGQGTQKGSVAAGGTYREITTVTPATTDAAAKPSAP